MIAIGVSQGLCEKKREQEGVTIVVPKSRCLFEASNCFLQSTNNPWCIEVFQPAFAQGHIHINVSNLRIEKCSDDIEMINLPAMFSNPTDGILNSGEHSDRDISFSKIHFFKDFNY